MIPSYSPQAMSIASDSTSELEKLFDELVSDIYAYLLHRTRIPDIAFDLTIDTFLSLYKKRHFFWWKDISDLRQIIQCAENACKNVSHWNEESSGQEYFQVLMKCLPFVDHADSAMRAQALIHVLHGIPLYQQKLAVLHLFLGWSSSKLSSVLRKNEKDILQELSALIRMLTEKLSSHSAFMTIDLTQFFSRIQPQNLSEDLRISLKSGVFDRYQKFESGRLRIAVPIAALLAVTTSVAGGSLAAAAYLLPSQPSSRFVQEFAAVDLLMLEKEALLEKNLQAIESDLQAIAAFHAEKPLLKASLELAYYASRDRAQITLQSDEILDRLNPLKFMTRKSEINAYAWITSIE